MKKHLASFSAALLLTIVSLTASSLTAKAQTSSDNLPDILAAINKSYGEAYAKNDSSLLINAYAPDACILAPGTPALCGPKYFLAFYRGGYKMGIRNIVFTTKALYGRTDEYVTEQGVFEMFDSNNSSLGKGKYLVLWKKTDQGWRMFRDMFNNDK